MPSANTLSDNPTLAPSDFTHSAQGTSLRRILGLPALVFFGLVYMVPLTVFTTYGIVTELTGGRTAGAYLVTLLAMLFTATSYSFMVKRFPVAGSAYSYTNMAFGPNIGFLAGWSLLLDYLFIPMINYLLIGLFLNIAFPAIPAWAIVLPSAYTTWVRSPRLRPRTLSSVLPFHLKPRCAPQVA